MSLKSNHEKVGLLVFHNFIVSCDGIYCRGINPNEEETQDAINEIDMDGSGKVIQYHVIFVSKKNRARMSDSCGRFKYIFTDNIQIYYRQTDFY